MKKWIVAGILLASASSFAQVQVSDFNINLDGRNDVIDAKDINRLQGRIKMGFTIDAAGLVEIVGLASTGPSFNNDWATVATNPNAAKDPLTLAFRQIYLRKVMGKVSIEAGALSPEPVIGASGLGATGWMDGVRVKVNTKVGDFKVVAGSLGDFTTPNAFARKFNGNFLEVEMDRKIFENLLTQSGIEVYEGVVYLKEGVKFDLKILGDKVIKTFAEVIYDTQNHAYNYEIGAEFDVLKGIMNKFDNYLSLKVYVSRLDENMLNRNNTVSAFYTYGTRTTIQLGGKIDQGGNLNWFARANLGPIARYDVGLTYKIPMKKKKP
jgi:hypothetical protein